MKEYKFKIGGQDYTATVDDLKGGNYTVTVNGQTYNVEVPVTKSQAPRVAMPATSPAAQTGGPKTINSELPGTVTQINVASGQHVKRGEVLLIVEAMKMGNEIVSEVDGTIQNVAVTTGQSVNQGDLLIEMVADFVAAKAEVTPKPAPVAPAPVATPAPAPAAPKPAAGNGITSPLPGTIVRLDVKVGDVIKMGQNVFALEAMKMTNEVSADAAGTVKAICAAVGDQVQSGQVIIELA